ncbi:EscU/YscU/HrcU family type III secretion system export apparatus switch protein [Bacillus litorisediminis]|uniref:EscU/YscU/HrcU family type III secretion system export apparatus switch protein n=1 Tax=Bacillus litorisediminis TaxID=2922713 RepID=UPI001FACDD50|nr:EscU/YscU/HrcU family type III secretion system export apparatus switch protein [Bacillus litorisediminis]
MTKEKRVEAVALKYDQNRHASPIVVAKGKGKIAENILAAAKEHQVPVQEDPILLSLLGQLDINTAIPEELYEAVAEVFAFIYRVDQQQKKKE